ncbi:MAG: hypothetical protein ACI4IF_02680 [Acutalibacteraceae bacterium]
MLRIDVISCEQVNASQVFRKDKTDSNSKFRVTIGLSVEFLSLTI